MEHYLFQGSSNVVDFCSNLRATSSPKKIHLQTIRTRFVSMSNSPALLQTKHRCIFLANLHPQGELEYPIPNHGSLPVVVAPYRAIVSS